MGPVFTACKNINLFLSNSGPCILLAVRSSSGGDFTAKQRTIAEVLEATGALKERYRRAIVSMHIMATASVLQ